jgi:hypothetical protein
MDTSISLHHASFSSTVLQKYVIHNKRGEEYAEWLKNATYGAQTTNDFCADSTVKARSGSLTPEAGLTRHVVNDISR